MMRQLPKIMGTVAPRAYFSVKRLLKKGDLHPFKTFDILEISLWKGCSIYPLKHICLVERRLMHIFYRSFIYFMILGLISDGATKGNQLVKKGYICTSQFLFLFRFGLTSYLIVYLISHRSTNLSFNIFQGFLNPKFLSYYIFIISFRNWATLSITN